MASVRTRAQRRVARSWRKVLRDAPYMVTPVPAGMCLTLRVGRRSVAREFSDADARCLIWMLEQSLQPEALHG